MAMVYNFRDRCLDIMGKRGYSMRRLEQETGVAYYQLQNWVDGKYPPVGLLIDIADELETTVAELLGLNDEADERLRRAVDDAKLAGCKTCRYGKSFVRDSVVCVRQGDCSEYRNKKNCWEWRGWTKEKTHE